MTAAPLSLLLALLLAVTTATRASHDAALALVQPPSSSGDELQTDSRRAQALFLADSGGPLVRKDWPAVTITYPPPNAVVSTQLTPSITFEATASDPDEALGAVAFLVCPASGTSCASPPAIVAATGPNPYRATWTPREPLILSAAGESTAYLVWAEASNALGQATDSSIVAFTVLQPPTQPDIDLIVPDAQVGNLVLEFISPASPVLYATATADTRLFPSSIVRVEFLDGITVIGTVAVPNAMPGGYAFVWSNPAAGVHMISARAVDSLGGWASSKAVPVYILAPDQPPSVTLGSPTSGQIFTHAGSVPLAASATSPGSIERVDFTVGATVIASVLSPPYTSNWLNQPPGHFAITAKAYDDLGLATASPAAHIEVLAAPRPPAVALTAPAASTTIAAGMPLDLAATALAPDGTISRVDFYAGNSLLGSASTAPYAYTWTHPSVGALSLTAKAYDLQGRSGTSTAVAVAVVNSVPPSVTLNAPAGGSALAAPGTVTLSASATPASGTSISRVDFLANGSLIGSCASAPYGFTWRGVAIGTYSLTARATDNLGNAASSTPVNISVRNDSPPSVTLTAPGNGQAFSAGQPIGLSATASDSDGTVTRVEFLVDGAAVASMGAGPYAFTWPGAGSGTHSIAARATDDLGVTTTSASATIIVVANITPAISVTAPASGQAFAAGKPITVTASASDSDGTIAKVEFLVDGVVIGTVGAGPYTMNWSGAAIGTHVLSARATDNRGAPATSTPITVIITSGGTPTVSLAIPRANQTFAAGATIHLAATAIDAGATIARVEFYAGSTLIGTATAPPYNVAWSNVPAGSYALTAKAIDNQTATAVSSGVQIQVITPTLTITSPAANASIASDFVLVAGTYKAPPNSGVTVNGVVASNDGQGNYLINNFPLTAGTNTLTVMLTSADGQAITQTLTVTRTDVAPLQVYVEPDTAVAPATFTVRLQNRTVNPYTNVTYQGLGGGQLDTTTLDQTTLGKITYVTPGVYSPRFVITDSAGNTYTETVQVTVQDKVVLDATLKSAWADFATARSSSDKIAAMRNLSIAALVRYGTVF